MVFFLFFVFCFLFCLLVWKKISLKVSPRQPQYLKSPPMSVMTANHADLDLEEIKQKLLGEYFWLACVPETEGSGKVIRTSDPTDYGIFVYMGNSIGEESGVDEFVFWDMSEKCCQDSEPRVEGISADLMQQYVVLYVTLRCQSIVSLYAFCVCNCF